MKWEFGWKYIILYGDMPSCLANASCSISDCCHDALGNPLCYSMSTCGGGMSSISDYLITYCNVAEISATVDGTLKTWDIPT